MRFLAVETNAVDVAVTAKAPLEGFPGDVAKLASASAATLFALDADEVARLQLEGARAQFAALRDRIPALATLAAEQGISEIESIDRIAPLLFSHQLYRSYPLRILETGQYDRLTAWLDNLTAYDLSGVDSGGSESLDEWMALLEDRTPLRPHAAPGPSGKVGFVPKDKGETALQVHGYFVWVHQGIAGESHADLNVADLSGMPFVFLNYRKGPHQQRIVDALVEAAYGGDESRVHALYPGRMSLDVMSLAGRLKAADERGSKVEIGPALQARRIEFVEQEKNRPQQVAAFFDRICDELIGKRILYFGSWTSLLEGAALAGQRGLSRLFAPDSLITTGGGYAGPGFEPGWQQRLVDFLGVGNLHDSYGSAEQMIPAQYCPADHYHPHPLTIPFLLDPDSGALLERKGTHTGRFAFLNLAARAAWGGFVTGDEVTITWDEPCACGRPGAYLHRAIRPYAAIRGGEDKISCAGMPTAHRAAMDYLAAL